MWSGVGITVAGIGMTIGGAVWNVTMKSPLRYDSAVASDTDNPLNGPNDEKFETHKVRIGSEYAASWTLIGAGIATTILGTILTGYAGYQYTHPNALAISIVPNGMILSGTF